MKFLTGLLELAVVLIYLIVAAVGIFLSYPMTIVVIAWQQALTHAEKIREKLNPQS